MCLAWLLIIDASTYLLLYNYSLPINSINNTNYRGATSPWCKNFGRRSIDISCACKTCFEYIHMKPIEEKGWEKDHLLIPVSS